MLFSELEYECFISNSLLYDEWVQPYNDHIKYLFPAIKIVTTSNISISCVCIVFYFVYEKRTWERKRYLEWIIKSECEKYDSSKKFEKNHVLYINEKVIFSEYLIKLECWTNIDVSCFYPLTKYCHYSLILLCFFL